MYRRLTLEQVKDALRKQHGPIVQIVDNTYVSLSKSATFIDSEYGQWTTIARLVINGHCHPRRGHEKTNAALRTTVDDVTVRLKQLWDGVAILDETTFIDRTKPARFVDRDYGEWWVKPLHVMKGTGRHPKRVRASVIAGIKLSIDDVVRRVSEKHNGRIKLCVETYVDTHTKARFIDCEYGEWMAAPYAVMQGMGHPRGKLKRAIATMRSYASVKHWKTGEICFPASGFEHAVLIWLNVNKYDFDWQVPIETPMLTPKLQKPVIYNVDFYVKSGPIANTYVEVKGTWTRRTNNDGGRAKWDWFHVAYPNSQLWMRDDLKRLGIIDAQRAYLEKARNDG